MRKTKKFLLKENWSKLDKNGFLIYIKENKAEIKKEIMEKMSKEELRGIAEEFNFMLTRNNFYSEMFNSKYDDNYGDLVKIAIHLELKSNNMRQIENYLEYLKLSDKNAKEILIMEIYVLYRLLDNPKKELLSNKDSIIEKINKAHEYNCDLNELAIIFCEYIAKISKTKSIENKEKIIELIKKKVNGEIVNYFSEDSSPTIKKIEDIKIAIIGSSTQKKFYDAICGAPQKLRDLGVQKKAIVFFDAWEKKNTKKDVSLFQKYDIVILGENDHFWAGATNTGSKGALASHLMDEKFTINNKIKVFYCLDLSQEIIKELIKEGLRQLGF